MTEESSLIGNLKTMMGAWHYYKDEVATMLNLKANNEDLPTKTSDLANDVPYAKMSDYEEIEDAINSLNVELNTQTGILRFTFVTFIEPESEPEPTETTENDETTINEE